MGKMGKKYVLLVAEGCPGCEEAEERLKRKGRHYEVLDVTKSLRAADMAKKLSVLAVPTLVEVDNDADQMCVLDYKTLTVRCARYSELERE